jgi:hypothetical protein
MIAVTRYQLAVLLRSHRWIPPAILYALAVAGLGGGSPPLGDGLRWSSLMLVPAVAWLTRSALTAEPDAARACLAAAAAGSEGSASRTAGPRRTQFAALTAALAIGAGYAVLGVGYELLASRLPARADGAIKASAALSVLGGGLTATLICLLVGSAVGALCNPPLIRHQAAGMLSTTAAVVLALASNVSPANAAARTVGAAPPTGSWLPGLPVVAAVILLGAAWTLSALAAGHRGG